MSTQIRGNTQILADSITNTEINSAAAIGWSKISKTSSSLADLATRSAGDLSSGTLADARLSTNVPLLNAVAAFSDTTDSSSTSTGALRTAGGLAVAKKAYIGGLLNVTGFGVSNFSAGGTGANALVVRNTTAGSGNYATIDVGNDADASVGRLFAFSSSYSTGTYDIADGFAFTATRAGGLSLAAIHASGVINFFTGGATKRAILGTGGAWQWITYGSGTIVSDASGNITVSSDARLKEIQGALTAGLREILAIKPILYKYTHASGLDTVNTYAGFSAQQVLPYIPQAIGENAEGHYTFNDRPVLAAVVNAIRELQDQIDALRAATGLSAYVRTVQPRLRGEGRIRRVIKGD